MALFLFILVGLEHLIIRAGLPSLDVKQTNRTYIVIHCVFKFNGLPDFIDAVACWLNVNGNHNTRLLTFKYSSTSQAS